MPLPFIPLFAVGTTLVAGLFGVKKGLDAKEDFDDAKKYNRKAKNAYEEANKELENARDNAQKSLETLGKLKFELYRDSIFPFIEAYDKIDGLEKKKFFTAEGELSKVEQIAQMKENSLELKEIVGGGITSLGAGGLAGLASYGSVGLIGATASTGTAIGGLSGVAATNATLAWLGGGTLATGGFGMAGGVAVLGGIVAGPVLAVGGMMLSSKAEAAKEDARANYAQAKLAVEEMKSATVVTMGIEKRFDELSHILTKLDKLFKPLLYSLVHLSNTNTDSATYTKKEDDIIDNSTMFAISIKNLLEIQVLDKNGNLTQESKKIIKKEREKII